MVCRNLARNAAHLALLLIALFALVACGGGGGDSGSSSSGSSSGGGGVGGSGGFALGATTASFRVLRGGRIPEDIRIPITVTGSRVAAVGAAFVNQVPPSWLRIGVEGTAPNYVLVLGLYGTNFPTSIDSATITVGTADSSGAVLASREVQVSYELVVGMAVGATPIDHSFVFGSSVASAPVSVTVGAAADKTWTITSNRSWLPVPGGNQTGNVTLTLSLNGAGTEAAPGGTATAQLVVQNIAEPVDRHVFNITAQIAAPRPVVSANPIRIGGFAGLDGNSTTVEVSLDTGTNAYPWTLSFDVPQSPDWLTSDVPGGNASSISPSPVTLRPGMAIGVPGNLTATAHFDAVVLGQTFRTSVPVTLRWHGQRLVPDQDGVAFSSFPSRPQPAVRTMRVRGSRDIDGIAWTAVSNQTWLTVTPSGVTGGDLTLQAEPSGLATDTVHLAEVTLTSTSANIERSERVRVGLWIGAANPLNISVNVADHTDDVVVNPVEPYAYLLSGGQVRIYNIYSGAEIHAVTDGIASGGGSLAVSSDGRTLYHANHITDELVSMDAASGAPLSSYQVVNNFGTPTDSDLIYTRVSGYPVLLTPLGNSGTTVFDVEAGTAIQSGLRLEPLRTVSHDGSRLFAIDGGSSGSTVRGYDMAFGALDGRTLQIRNVSVFSILGDGFTRQMCVSASSRRLYTLILGPLHEIDLSVNPPRFIREVPRPTSTTFSALDCNWNGRLYVSLGSSSGSVDNVLVIDPASGNSLGTFLGGPPASGQIVRLMRLSGDSRRMISVRTVSPGRAINFYDVPQ